MPKNPSKTHVAIVGAGNRKTRTASKLLYNSSMTKDLKRDIEFLYEMGNIRYIDRFWRRFLSPEFSNVAEHHFRVFWIAMIIAGREGGDVDTGKLAKLVLIHDIAESRTSSIRPERVM